MSVQSESAAWPLDVALVEYLQADTELMDELEDRGIYSAQAPQGAQKPYLVIGTSDEGDFLTFGRGGSDLETALHIWTDQTQEMGRRQALVIWGHLRRLLHYVPVPMDGHTMIRGTVRLVDVLLDDDGPFLHGLVTYNVLSRAEVV